MPRTHELQTFKIVHVFWRTLCLTSRGILRVMQRQTSTANSDTSHTMYQSQCPQQHWENKQLEGTCREVANQSLSISSSTNIHRQSLASSISA